MEVFDMSKIVVTLDRYITMPAGMEPSERHSEEIDLGKLPDLIQSMRLEHGEPVVLNDGSQLWVEPLAISTSASRTFRPCRIHHIRAHMRFVDES
jgi:hypothetical protein